MALVFAKTLEEYREKVSAPHMGVYGVGGTGKTSLAIAAARPPLCWRVLLVDFDHKPLPNDCEAAIYSAGGMYSRGDRVKDIVDLAGQVRAKKEKPFDLLVLDGLTALNREDVSDRVGGIRDPRAAYGAVMREMFGASELVKSTGIPGLSTLIEGWIPMFIRREADESKKNYGEIIGEGWVPENERRYIPALPKALVINWPAIYTVMARLRVAQPNGNVEPGARWLQTIPSKQEDAKTEYASLSPGLYLPEGVNGAALLFYPWLKQMGRATPELEKYWASYQAKRK